MAKVSQKFLESLAAHPRFGLMPAERRTEVGVAMEKVEEQQAESKGLVKTPSGEWLDVESLPRNEKEAIKRGGLDEWHRRFCVQVGAEKNWVRKVEFDKWLETADEESKVRLQEGEDAWRGKYYVKVGTDKDDWARREWYDTLPDSEKAEIGQLGSSAFMDKYFVKIGPDSGEMVKKEWFEGLKPEEQAEITAKGLKGTGYELFVKFGPDENLIPKSVYDESVAVGPGSGELVNKAWYEGLKPEEQGEITAKGLRGDAYELFTRFGPDKSLVARSIYDKSVAVGPDMGELVGKEWFGGLKPEEQGEIMAKGLKGTEYQLFETVGPDKELIPKRAVEDLISPDFAKWLAYQEFSKASAADISYSPENTAQIEAGKKLWKELADYSFKHGYFRGSEYRTPGFATLSPQYKFSPEQLALVAFGKMGQDIDTDPKKCDAVRAYMVATYAPGLVAFKSLVGKAASPEDYEKFLVDYNNVADSYRAWRHDPDMTGVGGRGMPSSEQMQEGVFKVLDKWSGGNVAKEYSTKYQDKLRELGTTEYGGWFDKRMADFNYVKFEPLRQYGEYVPKEYAEAYKVGLNWRYRGGLYIGGGNIFDPYAGAGYDPGNPVLSEIFLMGRGKSEGWKEYQEQQKAQGETIQRQREHDAKMMAQVQQGGRMISVIPEDEQAWGGHTAIVGKRRVTLPSFPSVGGLNW